MIQQQPPDNRTPSNPAITELQAIRQELVRLRKDFNNQKSIQSMDEIPSPASGMSTSSSWESVIFKVCLGICGVLSFFFCNSAGSTMQGLKSVSGGSVAELYYQSMGTAVSGLGLFIGGTLFYFAYSVPPVGFELARRKIAKQKH